MNIQLTLIEVPEPSQTWHQDWRIDDLTKQIGRRGLAQARAALKQHRPVSAPDNPDSTYSTACIASSNTNYPQAA
ncbi:MAG: hypothetical protein OXE93_02245 [bacterium]|nr:hypothetical protein [bacterium]MCY4163028.1 hypothetical protein [bacterium]MCY4258374.1 hypothetical protein [bacterium]